MVHVASSRRSYGDKAEEERVLGNFVVFVVLGHKGCLVISFSIKGAPRVGGEDQAFSHPSPTPKPKLLFERSGCALWCKRGEERK
jgi:hypothetical protein